MENVEVELNEKDYEKIMDIALRYFKNDSIRFGDKTSLCKSYLTAIQEYVKLNNLLIKDGKIYRVT